MPFSVCIVGGGLVGALEAIYMAKRGWDVHVYESRGDPRSEVVTEGRSINLAMSHRAITAMEKVGVSEEVMRWVVPMKGRMIHSLDGSTASQPYSIRGECINSVERKRLNEFLLAEAEKHPNVKVYFQHRLSEANLDSGHLVFEGPDKRTVDVNADLIVGADGVYSLVRSNVMKRVRMDFQQTYIDHGYVELHMEPSSDGNWQMDPNHLHIWPKHSYMMIALPNPDKTFTLTLFMPWDNFENLKTEEQVLDFFKREFPDVVPKVGAEQLVKTFFRNPKGSLVHIKCKPYNYKHRAVFIGDAAHAMVPFYGQGMNCGFEDCRVLHEILDKHFGIDSSGKPPSPDELANALSEYSKIRYPDVTTIVDLAMYNYGEMRHLVTDWRYFIRKKVEGWLHLLVPRTVIPLYSMVSFSSIPYSEVMQRWQNQTAWLERTAEVAILGTAVTALTVTLRILNTKVAVSKLLSLQ
ncbi:kynurenine 3-monooxygenase [Gonapodya prolifera JEL478]|uniref:Kynurenine 3-monooxygenase n=1 Tax=Gonapodya prolifera (strain JEL478) TaxID=1344416 RepID=A0A139AVJ9_GONPJ|nr:kynurenine 3-monooxygenase [Gonapodya prolifera JEL478]|eukprot:KXS20762.1 kynurenine 3-monooxygenase [Gonapodya prolifera JEL478]